VLKVVLDTNQFVSSLIVKKGVPAQLLEAWHSHAYILIASREILKEVEQVLHYPHITKKYKFQKEDIESLIAVIKHEAIVFFDTPEVNVIKEDPQDNKILACALKAHADYIVSGDHHLLNLGWYKNIAIVSARDFLEIINYNPREK
jgi:uncharacterized protein